MCNSRADPLTRPQTPLAALTAALSALLPAPLPCPACPALAAPYTARTCQLLIPSTQTPGHHWAALVWLPIGCRKEGHPPPCPYRSDPPPCPFFFLRSQDLQAGRGGYRSRAERGTHHKMRPQKRGVDKLIAEGREEVSRSWLCASAFAARRAMLSTSHLRDLEGI